MKTQENKENEILLHLGQVCWLATFVGPHSVRVANLFGTCTIPTAWTETAPIEAVIAGVAAGNPNASVKHWLGWQP